MRVVLKHRILVQLSARPQSRCISKLVTQAQHYHRIRNAVRVLAGVEVYTTPVVSQLIQEEALLTSSRLDTKPSKDLKELCTLQLGLLESLLKRSGQQGQLCAAVYLRVPGTDNSGLVQLRHVASVPSVSVQQSGIQPVSQRPQVCQDVSLDGWSQSDTCLVNEEVLVSPSNGLLVMPLVDKQVLVGLLLVETSPSAGSSSAMPYPSIQITHQTANLLSQHNGWSEQSVPSLLQTHELPQHDNDMTSNQQQQVQIETDNQQELLALRAMAPLLAKACAMEQASLLAKIAASSQAAAASKLLQEAKRATQALSTFNAMLVPRLEEGTPDKDLARGIAIQEQRLRDVLKQLNAALPPTHYDTSLLERVSIDSSPAEPAQATTIDMELDAQDSRLETTSIVSTNSTSHGQPPLS